MKTLGVTVATLGLVLVKLTVTPLAGAAVDRLIGRLAVWPGPSVGSAPRLITLLVTVTWTLPGAKPVAVAVIVVAPGATPVTVKRAGRLSRRRSSRVAGASGRQAGRVAW